MTREVLVDLPSVLLADVESEGIEEIETFRASEIAQAIAVTITTASLGANLASVAVAQDAIHEFVSRLRTAVLRHTPDSEQRIQLEYTVRDTNGRTAVKFELHRSGVAADEQDLQSLSAELLKAVTQHNEQGT